MIKAVIFDLDDTLYDYESINKIAIDELCKYTCNLLGISKELFKIAFDYGRNETKKGLENVAAGHNRMIYCQKTLEFLKVNPIKYALDMYNVYWDSMLRNMKLNKNALQILEFLREKKVKIGICTDLTANIQHRKIRNLKIDEYIDCVVTSEEAGEEKPGTNMFNLTLEKLELDNKEVIYVGDNFKKDVLGAGNVGILPVWYNPNNKERLPASIEYDEINDLIKIEKYFI